MLTLRRLATRRSDDLLGDFDLEELDLLKTEQQADLEDETFLADHRAKMAAYHGGYAAEDQEDCTPPPLAAERARTRAKNRHDRSREIYVAVHAEHFGEVHCVGCGAKMDVSRMSAEDRAKIRRCSGCLSRTAKVVEHAKFCRHCGRAMAPLANLKAQATRAVCDPCKPEVERLRQVVDEEVRQRLAIESA